MALTKVTYVDKETVIGAENLNAIQDNVIANANVNTSQTAQIQQNTEAIATINQSLTAINAKEQEQDTKITNLESENEVQGISISDLVDRVDALEDIKMSFDESTATLTITGV